MIQSSRRPPARDISTLPARLAALDLVIREASEQLDRRTAAAAEQLQRRAGQRMYLSSEHTVVALAGGTGSGKSSLFNALTGLEISRVGLRRPTTSAPYACVWGDGDATALLDWLEVPLERRLGRESELDADTERELHGLVLLDLPDHDSVEVAHRLEVDRLVDLVDVLVWVLDPQKYGDVAIHEHYLKPLKTYADAMFVVLNQSDRLDPGQAQSCLEDLRRMLTDDGLGGVRTLLTSAMSRVGVADLRSVLVDTVATRQATARRIAADLDALSARLARAAIPEVAPTRVDDFGSATADALSQVAGVSRVGAAVAADYRSWGRHKTGWRPLAWRHGREQGVPPLAVLRADVDQAARTTSAGATAGLPRCWRARLEQTALANGPALADGLDAAVHRANQEPLRSPAWWQRAAVAQWLLIVLAVAGVVLAVTAAVLSPGSARVLELTGVGLALLGVLLGLLCDALFERRVTVESQLLRRAVEDRVRAEVDKLAEKTLFAPLRADLEVCNVVQRTLASFAAAEPVTLRGPAPTPAPRPALGPVPGPVPTKTP